jgi:hypothetical protein
MVCCGIGEASGTVNPVPVAKIKKEKCNGNQV